MQKGKQEQTRGSGYSLTKNIAIIGGTFDGGNVAKAKVRANLVIFGHAEGIRIQNATFKNCYGSHLIELAGVKNCVIDSCTFDGSGFRYNDAHDESEAVQIDICAEGLNGSFGADKTPCDGVTVQNSIIKNYPRAIGNHNTVSGARNKNIKLSAIRYPVRNSRINRQSCFIVLIIAKQKTILFPVTQPQYRFSAVPELPLTGIRLQGAVQTEYLF